MSDNGFGVTSEQRSDDGADVMPPSGPAGGGRRRGSLIRRLILLVLAILLLPYVLIVIYASSAVRPVSTLMLADLVTGGYERRWVPFEEISKNLVTAVMMSEDGQFCFHDGVDWEQMKVVVDDALAGEATRGASTIAMQTAKNLFLWNSRSVVRKGLELPLALASDLFWSKRRLMEIYLNVAEWGPGIYGIEAAANHHFKISAAKLSRRQAALLAASLPNPIARIAGKPSPGLNRLAGRIERRMKAAGDYIKCLYG